jgi:hypothetical protein
MARDYGGEGDLHLDLPRRALDLGHVRERVEHGVALGDETRGDAGVVRVQCQRLDDLPTVVTDGKDIVVFVGYALILEVHVHHLALSPRRSQPTSLR